MIPALDAPADSEFQSALTKKESAPATVPRFHHTLYSRQLNFHVEWLLVLDKIALLGRSGSGVGVLCQLRGESEQDKQRSFECLMQCTAFPYPGQPWLGQSQGDRLGWELRLSVAEGSLTMRCPELLGVAGSPE